MSIKRKARTVVAALIVGGVSAIAAQAASAATPACSATGATCLSVFSPELGTYASPNFVEHVFGGVASIGTPTGLTTASSSDPSEDFINPLPGETVADFYAKGLVSAAVNLHYGTQRASQLEYSPDGIKSGLCVAVATDPFQGEPITLQPCTVPGVTVFIVDTMDSPATAAMGLFPLVSGATEDFAHPFTMSYPRHPNTAKTLPPIRLRHLHFDGPDRTVPANQLWGVASGIQ
ncbi:MAG TPA: hypothetical protein VGI50_06735 [Solirubrobacteraceae bacterium]|jgi:hypothetical protein